MRTREITSVGATWVAGLALAVTLALLYTSSAAAQSFEAQYGSPQAPSGAASGATCAYVQSDDGVLNAGDVVEYRGDYSVPRGASVVLDDADGTEGTLVDGRNAEISGTADGGVRVAVTGDPINIGGANGVMNDTVCNSIVASTGLSATDTADSSDPASEGLLLGVLPDTGGPMLFFLYFGTLVVAGGGLLLLRSRALRG